jgi:hypothetical protein
MEMISKFNIRPLASEHPLSVLSLIVDKNKFWTNSNTGYIMWIQNRYHIPMPNTNLSINKKWVYFSGIKLYNNLPPAIKSLSHDI